ncbi:MAG: hypothetical protein V4604_06135 [Bacteroidota bacterium]
MLILLLVLAIGMSFYRLAKKFHKQAWGYAFLGIGVFIATPLVVGTILWLILSAIGSFRDMDFVIALWSILACVVAVVTLYYMLKRAWSRKPKRKSYDDLIDQ